MIKTDLNKQRVNYNHIAHLYDEPLRDHDVDDNLLAFLAERPLLNPTDLRILDMGCGTGKQLTANRSQFPETTMVGMDLFVGMMQQAQKRNQTANWVNGDNMAAPFADGSFHYITNQFSYAHVQNKAKFFAEAYRILVENGRFVVTNINPWQMPHWPIYRYFPAAQKLDFNDFLPQETLVTLFAQAGFGNIQAESTRLVMSQTLSDFQSFAASRHRASELLAISDAAYADGLQNIQKDLAKYGAHFLCEYEVFVLTIRGDKVT